MRSKQTETVSRWSTETKKKDVKISEWGGEREEKWGRINTRAQRGADETKLNEEHVPRGQRLAGLTQDSAAVSSPNGDTRQPTLEVTNAASNAHCTVRWHFSKSNMVEMVLTRTLGQIRHHANNWNGLVLT